MTRLDIAPTTSKMERVRSRRGYAHTLLTAAGVGVVAMLSGCTASAPPTVPSTQAEAGTSSSPNATPQFTYPTDRVRLHQTNDDYSYTVELDLGPVIPWTNTEASQAAWTAVGGKGEPPCGTQNPSYFDSVGYRPSRAGHAYGTLRIINDIPKFGPGDVRVIVAEPTMTSMNAIGWETPSGSDCEAFSGGALTPHVDDNVAQWGPVPVDLVIDNYISPAHPEGDPDRLAEKYTLSAVTDDVTTFSLRSYR